MQISEFTRSKLDYFEIMCNYTADEMTLFRLRADGKSLDECAELMHRSLDATKALSRKVNAKIKQEL